MNSGSHQKEIRELDSERVGKDCLRWNPTYYSWFRVWHLCLQIRHRFVNVPTSLNDQVYFSYQRHDSSFRGISQVLSTIRKYLNSRSVLTCHDISIPYQPSRRLMYPHTDRKDLINNKSAGGSGELPSDVPFRDVRDELTIIGAMLTRGLSHRSTNLISLPSSLNIHSHNAAVA